MRAGEKRFLLGALVVAYVLRLLHWQSLAPYPWFDFLGLDALYYDEWAKRLVRDGWQGEEPFFMGPLYPYLLSILYRIFGPTLDAVRQLQMVLSVASVALIHLFARRLGGPRLAMIASGIAALYGPFIYYAPSILYPTLTIFLATALLLLLWDAAEHRSVPRALAAGAVLGIYALGRGNILLFAPLAFLWLIAAWGRPRAPSWAGWRNALPGALALTAGTVLLILPATFHNLRAGDVTLLTTNGGLNFYIGNGPMANGGHVTPVLYRTAPDGSTQAIPADLTRDVECRTEAELALGRSLRYTEVSSFWFAETVKWIRLHPDRFVSGLVRKFAHFWSTYEIPQIEHYGYFRHFSLPLRAPVPTFALIGPLSVLGMALVLRRPGAWWLPFLFVAGYSASIILFFVLARYRLPVLPALIPFAALAAERIVDAVRGRAWRFVALAAGSAAVVGWMMQANPYGVDESKGIAQIVYRHGIVEDAAGNWDAAIAHYEEALRLKPEYPKGHLNLGVDLARVGRLEEAMVHLREAERLDPTYYRAAFNQGSVLEQLGRPGEAEEAYARAVALEPQALLARLALGEMRVAAGDTAAARAEFTRIVEYDGRWDPESNNAARARAGAWLEYLDSRATLAAGGFGGCFGEAGYRAAEVARMRGRPEAALAALRGYFESGGSCAEAYRSLARMLVAMRRNEDAEDSLRRALAADPRFPDVRVMLAQIVASRGDAQEALRQLQEEIRYRPGNAAAYLEAGLVEERLRNDAAEAERWFTRYREAGGDPDHLAARRGHWTGRGTGSAEAGSAEPGNAEGGGG